MADHTVTVESTLEALLGEKKYSTIRDILSTKPLGLQYRHH